VSAWLQRVWPKVRSRLWPKRLAGQMIALMLLALVLAQLLMIVIFADERRLAVRAADRAQVLGRTVSIVRLLEASPPALHGRILETASGGGLRFWLADESAVDPEEAEATGPRLGARLAAMLGDQADREILVDFEDQDHGAHWPWRGHWFDDDDDEKGHRAWRHRRPGPFNLLIATRLADGRWLNLETLLPPAPRVWGRAALTYLVITALALSLVVVLMVRRITRPMAALAAAAERAGRGEAVAPLPEVGPLDIRQTTRAFNRMHDRLQRFVQDRTRMLAAMSHDLRTPITSLRLRAEFIEDEEIKAKVLETLEEMQRMTEATLAFAREEAAAEDTRTVDLAALVESVVADLADLGQEVAFAPADRLPYACRPLGIKRALRNLIENAVRYGKRARLRLERGPDSLRITIDDDGPGIAAADAERVFQPFVRLEESRSAATGGIGLGLSIARSIIRGHGGEIDLLNRAEGGLQAVVTLPLAAAA
jgi:signal transduction histidine kinase